MHLNASARWDDWTKRKVAGRSGIVPWWGLWWSFDEEARKIMTIVRMVSRDALSNITTTYSINPKNYLCQVSRFTYYLIKATSVPLPICGRRIWHCHNCEISSNQNRRRMSSSSILTGASITDCCYGKNVWYLHYTKRRSFWIRVEIVLV